jgi:glycosyltransferase involved in cell wall biosynthesis
MSIDGKTIVEQTGGQPKVSIITVCYNSAETIRDTIESVINQSYPNIEYIIVDGGSTDGTIDIIRSYEQHISKWVSEPDGGIYDAMNKGIKWATGEIIGLVNSDDHLELDAIENVAQMYLEHIDADAFCGKLRIIDESNNTSYIVSPVIPNQNKFNAKVHMPHPSIFVKKGYYISIGLFNTEYEIAADYELLRRAIQYNKKFVLINSVLSNMRLDGISSTQYIKAYKENRTIDIRYGFGNLKATYKFMIATLKTYLVKLLVNNKFLANKYAEYKNNKQF